MLNNVTIRTKRERQHRTFKVYKYKTRKHHFFFNVYLLIITIFKAPHCSYIITILEANV